MKFDRLREDYKDAMITQLVVDVDELKKTTGMSSNTVERLFFSSTALILSFNRGRKVSSRHSESRSSWKTRCSMLVWNS
jgi:hypothetical protein